MGFGPSILSMKLVQVIGLPGSGKTYAITQFANKGLVPFVHLDIANYISEKSFISSLSRLSNSQYSIIAESASGILRTTNYIVKLKLNDYELWMQRLHERADLKFNPRYFAYLEARAIPANYTVESSEDLTQLLCQLLKSR